MAVKDHSLDDKIIQAATEEFLEHGFTKASLHKIAEKAGTTTGALYTRYQNKDDLFQSLVAGLLSEIGAQAEEISSLYYEKMNSNDPEQILDVISLEFSQCLDIMFRHYDACALLFCRSQGSSLERMVQEMMKKKADSTVDYLKRIAKRDVNLDGLDIILMQQFNFYGQIIDRGYDKERAVQCMKNVEKFLMSGWRDLFKSIL